MGYPALSFLGHWGQSHEQFEDFSLHIDIPGILINLQNSESQQRLCLAQVTVSSPGRTVCLGYV